jgi:hypothetical protein
MPDLGGLDLEEIASVSPADQNDYTGGRSTTDRRQELLMGP